MDSLPAPITPAEINPLIERAVLNVREDLRDNPYILEALRVLPVQGYRSAIGSFWNAVVHDLRNKVIYRSIDLFSKEVNVGRAINTYEDIQNHVTDDKLLEGSYKIGVISWEAHKMLSQARVSRNVFEGHPFSSDPSIIKVLSFIDDCIKYVLNAEFPIKIIDIADYIEILKQESFDRNALAIENAVGDLPLIYINELANRFFTIYICPDSSSTLISNIEFVAPLLWKVLPKEIKVQIVRRVDQIINKGDINIIERAFSYVRGVGGEIYLSHFARMYKIQPLVEKLESNLDNWSIETECVRELSGYAEYIIDECIDKYVWALTQTYVGTVGSSQHFSRTDFYSNGAVVYITSMFQAFNDQMCSSFVQTLRKNDKLKSRIRTPSKLRRLRTLGNIIHEKISEKFEDRAVIEALINEDKEEQFFEMIRT